PFPQTARVKLTTPGEIVVHDNRFGEDGPATLLDPKTGKSRRLPGKLGEAGEDVLLAVAPDGKTVVSLEPRKASFRVWSWPAGELHRTVPLAPPGKFRVSRCAAGAFTPDGRQFVAVMHYADPAAQWGIRQDPDHAYVERWDLDAGKLLGREFRGQG